jgi:putative transposase
MKGILLGVAASSNFSIEVMEVDKNHVHMLISYPPTLSVCAIVRRLKQLSTAELWRMYPNYLAKEFWKERTFWSDGYFACSTGDASSETIKKYIEQQG